MSIASDYIDYFKNISYPFGLHKGTPEGYSAVLPVINEPRCEKTGLRGFRPGPTQTGLYSYRRWLEA